MVAMSWIGSRHPVTAKNRKLFSPVLRSSRTAGSATGRTDARQHPDNYRGSPEQTARNTVSESVFHAPDTLPPQKNVLFWSGKLLPLHGMSAATVPPHAASLPDLSCK
jgi:hypothetical protein